MISSSYGEETNNKFSEYQKFILKMRNIGCIQRDDLRTGGFEVDPSIACLKIIPPDNFVVKLCYGYWWSSSILVIISVLASPVSPHPRLLLTMNF